MWGKAYVLSRLEKSPKDGYMLNLNWLYSHEFEKYLLTYNYFITVPCAVLITELNALVTKLIFAEEMWKLRCLCISTKHKMPQDAEG